jgi:hypothetical protein
MIIRQIALVSESPRVSLTDLMPVCAALQKQVTRDLSPVWNIGATVDCFAALENVPPGYWSVTVMQNPPGQARGGIHEDRSGQPFALVPDDDGWSLSASHEVMEMLVDPFSRFTISGQSPRPGQGRVDFLVEICDPCQTFGYSVNGVAVSDFYTPHYFDPVANSAVRYSFTGSIQAPRQVLKGGYLSWFDSVSGHWFQQNLFGSKTRIIDMGVLVPVPNKNFRSLIYLKTPKAFTARRLNSAQIRKLRQADAAVRLAAESRSASLRQQIASIMSGRLEVY